MSAYADIYTYTIFDANPASSGPCAWDHRANVEFTADSDEDAIGTVETVLAVEAVGLDPAAGYVAGERLWATVWAPDGGLVKTISHEITDKDLA